MTQRVAICALAQTKFEANKWHQRQQGMVWEVVKPVIEQVGLRFGPDEIDSTVTVSDDLFDARSISDNAVIDAVGAHFRPEAKVSSDGIQGLYYAVAQILSGHHDVVLLVAHCKESQCASRNQITHLAFDPFFGRPVGLDYLTAAALQAQAYMAKSHVTEEQLAALVSRAREWARQNPNAQETTALSQEEALAAPYIADPLRESFVYPVSDGAIAMVLASEARAAQLTDKPVWVTGLGNCHDTFGLGERDLAGMPALGKAACKALGRAGITDSKAALNVVEISDPYAYQIPQVAEGLGLCTAGEGGAWLGDNGPDAWNVNRSGGVLAGNPLILGGLARVAECVLQLRGEAGTRQVADARCALAHGACGPAGQLQSVAILEA